MYCLGNNSLTIKVNFNLFHVISKSMLISSCFKVVLYSILGKLCEEYILYINLSTLKLSYDLVNNKTSLYEPYTSSSYYSYHKLLCFR